MQFVFVHENNWYKAFLKSLCCMTIFILFFSKVNHITGVTQQINVKTRISWLERSTTSVWSLFFLRLTGGGGLFFALSSLTAHNSRLGNLVVTASFTFNFVDWAEKEIGKNYNYYYITAVQYGIWIQTSPYSSRHARERASFYFLLILLMWERKTWRHNRP